MRDIVGYLAGALTTIAFLPQVIKAWRTRRTEDLSLGMYLTFNIGVALWLIYGILLGSFPIIAANVLTLLLTGSILVLQFHGARQRWHPGASPRA